MTDVLRFTVTAQDHRALCDAADDIVYRYLHTAQSAWIAADSSMDVHQSTQTLDGTFHLFTADVTVHIERRS